MRILSLIATTLLTLCLTTPLLAGTEPSPFKPEINKLEAVTNGLNSVLDRASKVLSMPPDDIMPSPALKGAVNRLEAMDKQVFLFDAMTFSIVEEVVHVDNYGTYSGDIIPALTGVLDAAQAIADLITETMSGWETPPPEAFIQALNDVVESAQILSSGVQQSIEDIENPPIGECTRDDSLTYDQCTDPTYETNCEWITVTNGDAIIDEYCCCTGGSIL